MMHSSLHNSLRKLPVHALPCLAYFFTLFIMISICQSHLAWGKVTTKATKSMGRSPASHSRTEFDLIAPRHTPLGLNGSSGYFLDHGRALPHSSDRGVTESADGVPSVELWGGTLYPEHRAHLTYPYLRHSLLGVKVQ